MEQCGAETVTIEKTVDQTLSDPSVSFVCNRETLIESVQCT